MRTAVLRLLALALCVAGAVPAARAQAPAAPPAATKPAAPPAASKPAPAAPAPAAGTPAPSTNPSPNPNDPANAIMSFEDYDPKSTLIVPQHPITRAKYPFVDVHNHQNPTEMTPAQVDELAKAMDGLNMAVMVNLSGGSGADFQKGLANLTANHPNRFVQFANVDFKKIDEPNFGENAAKQLEQDVKNGARGLKVFKNLGMFVKDKDGKRVQTDDPRIDPVWAKCGELGIPVLIHVGEPMSFWLPWDLHNERWLELKQYPNRRRDSAEFAPFEQTISELHNVIRKHPKTIFINAHLGWLGHDLARLGKLMDEMPNMYTEIGAVLYDLGRQPKMAREFMTRHQDRVLFGKDIWEPSEYHPYFRTLETADEYFPYYRKRHAFWSLYGLELPDEVLRKLYYKNALRIIPGLDKSLFPAD